MERVITIHLEGQAAPYRVDEAAYDALDRYLDQARSRLTDDTDQAEVMGDLERSIGAKLSDRLGSADRILTVADVTAVLDAVGPVGSGDDRPPNVVTDRPRRRRRLYRIRQGQWFAGVCTGLAAYGEFGVDWVRTIFILLSVATAGLFALVYLVMALVLPVVPTREAWIAEMDAEAGS